MNADLLTISQLVAETGQARDVIYDAIRAGVLPYVRYSPRGTMKIARVDWDRYQARLRRNGEALAGARTLGHLVGLSRKAAF